MTDASLTFSATTMKNAWEMSIKALLHSPSATLVDSATGGPADELQCVQIRVEHPTREPKVSPHYIVPELIPDYANLFTPYARAPNDALRISDRLYAWRGAEQPIDQIAAVIAELSADPNSRRAVLSMWDPARDLAAIRDSPLVHCVAWVSIRESRLHLALVSRSVNAWLGAVPNMVAFVGLMEHLAGELRVDVGSYTWFVFSYHIYRQDVPSAARALG